MTIKEVAAKYGISQQAIYQRIKNNGISLKSLKDQKTGELTPDALGILENLFGESSEKFNQQRMSKEEELTRLRTLLQSLEHENELLKIKLEASEAAKAAAVETLNQERSMFTRLLPAPRPSLWERLKGKK